MANKAQVAMEYMILVGFILALIIPVMFLLSNESSDVSLQVNSQQIRLIGQDIVDKAESVYYLGEPSQLRFRIEYPINIKNITVTNRSLVFIIQSEVGVNEIVVSSSINMSGTLSTDAGIHFVTLENKGDYVNITSN